MGKRSTRAAASQQVPAKVKSVVKKWQLLAVGAVWALALALAAFYPRSSKSGLFADVEAEVQRGEVRSLPSDVQGHIRHFAFNTSRHVQVHVPGKEAWSFEEMEGHVPDGFAESSVLRVSSLASPEVAEQLLQLSKKLLYEEGPDTVDQHPTFEAPLFRDGLPKSSPQYMDVLSKVVENRALPYVRERFNCSTCVACTSIVRRYQQGERLKHPWHYDSDAYVTMVVPLTAAADYSGGLYIQHNFDRNEREFVGLAAGDALFHSYDVMHGVEVLSGERVALIIWFKTDADSCKRRLSPWYAEAADRGNPAAQYNLGRVVANGLGGTEEDKPAGIALYTKAAKQGHVMAMYNLAVCLHHGRGIPSDKEAAVDWYAQAAHAGHPLAMTNYGYMQLFGLGVNEKNVTGAAFWFQKAALQGVDVAMFQLSHLLEKGTGIQANLSKAKDWLEQAASNGHKDSKIALIRLSSTGSL